MKSHHAYPLAAMKAALVDHIFTGKISVSEAARSMKKSRPTIYAWMTRHKAAGIDGLLPKKTGPKNGRAWNRSTDATETAVMDMLAAHHDWNIYDIAAHLPEEHRVHPTTVWRIWARHQHMRVPVRLPRPKPQLYVKEEVGEEIQLDTSFPWGRAAKRVSFDCLDDRSRFALAQIYDRCTQDNAVAFLHYVIAHAPFVIRAIRTDCGREFGTRFSIACALAGITHTHAPRDLPRRRIPLSPVIFFCNRRRLFRIPRVPLPGRAVPGDGRSPCRICRMPMEWVH